MKKIKTALISVFDKTGLEPLLEILHQNDVEIYSTGGTQQFIEQNGYTCNAIENLTQYPSILDGRVKTLHPKVFGGILAIRNNKTHQQEIEKYEIPYFDAVIVDLYPFEKTILNSNNESEIIEKIDIGGISLIRAAAKNFNDCVIIPSRAYYDFFIQILKENAGKTSVEHRKKLMIAAFEESSKYDETIKNYFSNIIKNPLRYGENPHQKAHFNGDLNAFFNKIQGKELSYNNLVDIDAAVQLMNDLPPKSVVIIKHTNACGVATRNSLIEAWEAALACDPVSAFGGIIITNEKIDIDTARLMHNLFFEVLIAPDFDQEALQILSIKSNRILLQQKIFDIQQKQTKTILNGTLIQDNDIIKDEIEVAKCVTKRIPNNDEKVDLAYANICAKHLKSNTIAIVKNKQMIGMGCGQTSRVDAINQAIHKAQSFGFDLQGAVIASDAFFPFNDCVQIAHKAGITAVIQPGGSIKDIDSTSYCDSVDMAMLHTGIRHFKH